MPEKDHLTTSYSNAKRENKEIRNLMTGLFISNNPPQSETIADTSIDIIADTVNSITAPIQGAFNDLGENTASTVEILLDKVNAGLHEIQLPALDEVAINFSNFVTNKFQTFFLDLTKADNETTPAVTFTPPINGLTQDEINENNRICVEVLAVRKEGGVTLDVVSGGGGGGAGGEFFGPWTALHDGGKQQLSNLSAVLFASGTEEYSGAIKSVAETGVIVTVPDSHSFQIRSGSFTSNNVVLEFDNTNGLDLRDHSAVRVGSIAFSGTAGKSITSSGQLDLNFTVPLTGDMSFIVGSTTYLETNSEFTRIDIRENLYFPTNRSILGITGLTFLAANSIIINAVNNDLTLTVPTGGNITFKEGANHTNMIIDGAANRVQFNGDIRMLSSTSTITDLNTLNFSDDHEIKSSISALEFHIDDSTDKFSFIYENSDGDNTEILSIGSGGLNLNSSGLDSVGLLSGVSGIGFTNTGVSIANALTDLNFQVPLGGDIRFREATATILELNGTNNTIVPYRNIVFNASVSSISAPINGDLSLRVGVVDYIKLDSSSTEVEIGGQITMTGGSPFDHINSVGELNFNGSHAIEGLSTSLDFHLGASTDKFSFIYENSDENDVEILSISSGGIDLNSSGLVDIGVLSGVSAIGFTNTGVTISNTATTDLNFKVPTGGDIRFVELLDTILELNGTSDTIIPHRNIAFNSSTSSITNLGTLTLSGTTGKSIASSGTVDMNISVPLTGDIEFRVGTSDYMKIDGGLGQVRFSNSINMISGAPFNHISGVGAINIEGSHKIEGLSTSLNFHIGASTDKFSFIYENSGNVDTEILSIDSGGLNLNSSGLDSVGGLTGVSSIGFTNTAVSMSNALTDLNFQVPSGGDIRFRELTATILELNGTSNTIRAHRNLVFNSSISSITNLGTLGFSGTAGKSIASSGTVDMNISVPLTGDIAFRVGTSDYMRIDGALAQVRFSNSINMISGAPFNHISGVGALNIEGGHKIEGLSTALNFHIGASTDKFSFYYENSSNVDTEIISIDSGGLNLNSSGLGSVGLLSGVSGIGFTNTLVSITNALTDLNFQVPLGGDIRFRESTATILELNGTNNTIRPHRNIVFNSSTSSMTNLGTLGFSGTAGKSITSSGNVNLIMAVPATGDMSFRVGSTDYIKLDSSSTEIEINQNITMTGTGTLDRAISSVTSLGFQGTHFIRGLSAELQFDLGATTDKFSFVYGTSNTEILHIDSNGLDMNNNTISNFSFGNVPKLDFTNNHYIDSDPNELHIVVDGSTDTISFGYSPTDTSILGIANFSGTNGLNMLSNGIINAGTITGASRITFSNDQYITSESSSLNLHVDSSSEKVVFEYGNSQTVFADISSSNGLDMKSNDIRNIGIASVTTLRLGTGQTISSSGNDLIIRSPTSGDLIFREGTGSLEFLRLDGGNNDIRFNRDITMIGLTEINFLGGLGMSGDIDMNSNDIEDIGTLDFGETNLEIKSSGSNMVYQVPSGDDHIFEEGNFEFMRMNGGTNNIEFERNLVLNNGRSIRSDSSAEIGFFVTNSTSATGSQGSMQIPTSTAQGVTTASLNLLFGSALGCIGFLGLGQSTTSLAIKNTSSSWTLITLPSSGVVTTAST